jgi:hypothetical protein
VYYSYAFSGRRNSDGEVVGFPASEDRDVDFSDDQVTRNDFGAAVGAGVMLQTGPIWIGVDLRYRKGFSNLNTDGDSKDDYKPMNNVFSPTINLYFPLARN